MGLSLFVLGIIAGAFVVGVVVGAYSHKWLASKASSVGVTPSSKLP